MEKETTMKDSYQVIFTRKELKAIAFALLIDLETVIEDPNTWSAEEVGVLDSALARVSELLNESKTE